MIEGGDMRKYLVSLNDDGNDNMRMALSEYEANLVMSQLVLATGYMH